MVLPSCAEPASLVTTGIAKYGAQCAGDLLSSAPPLLRPHGDPLARWHAHRGLPGWSGAVAGGAGLDQRSSLVVPPQMPSRWVIRA
jgi:hypothetical protein